MHCSRDCWPVLAVTFLVVCVPRLDFDIAVTGWFGARQEPWLVAVLDGVRLIASQLPLLATPVLALVLCAGSLRAAARCCSGPLGRCS